MSNWNHYSCEECYDDIYHGRQPIKLTEDKAKPCCFCGRPTFSGIYVRRDPSCCPNVKTQTGEHSPEEIVVEEGK